MDRDRTKTPLRVDIRRARLTLLPMLVRICLLVLLAMALVAGCTATADGVHLQAEVVEIGAEEALVTRPSEPPAPVVSPVPALVRGTEVEHPSPVAARVFRPPRVAFGC